jgi:integrase
MPRKAKELGPLQVGRLKEPGKYHVGGVAGLILVVGETGAKSWVLRYRISGRRREMGLGGFPDVTLAGAHKAAREAHERIKTGFDPIEHSVKAKAAIAASRAKEVTFKNAALTYIASHERGWSAKSHFQWSSTLENHAYPLIGDKFVRDIGVNEVMSVLKPLWHDKTETASRIRGRIEKILDWARVSNLREGENPARWKGHLEMMLPAPALVQDEEHFRAIDHTQMPVFMKRLAQAEGMGARCLEFTILTVARSAMSRGARWEEIDLEAAIWTVPKERMKAKNLKAKREHRVPLSQAAKTLLLSLQKTRRKDCELIFPSDTGKELSDATMSAVLKRMGVNAVPHGFRSTFTGWASEVAHYPKEMRDMALAHVIEDKVEAAYRRGDLYLKRVQMMEDWAAFCYQTK